MSDESVVLLAHEGPISILTINRPKVLNALNTEVLRALGAALTQISARSETRCVILTGAGDKAFVAGADIAAMSSMTTAQAAEFARFGHEVMAALDALAMPVIAAVNGFALGGGCELALSCDFIYASEKAKFGQPEVNLGVVPGFGGTQRLARRVGIAMARELVYTGAMIGAEEALRIGLANKVVAPDQLMEEAKKTAQLIAQKGPFAVARAKRIIAEGLDGTLSAGNALEIAAFAACFDTSDQKEGMQAFLEKRAAAFTGR
jgi:enoyl-CoA hydratase